jgi:hypothetical protein
LQIAPSSTLEKQMTSKWIITAAAAIGFGIVGLPAQSAPPGIGNATHAVVTGDTQLAHYRDGYYRYHRHYRVPRGYFYYEPPRYRYWRHHHRRHHSY